MSWATVVAARVRGLFLRRRLERELDDEVRFHLEMQMEDNVRAGMSEGEARRAAMRQFGGRESMKETYRERRGFAPVETTLRDLRYAARMLWKSPAFTVTAVTVLALAIGANTAVFSVLNAVLFRPLPYAAPGELAMFWTEDPLQNRHEGRSSLWDIGEWRRQSQSFVDIASFDTVGMTLTTAEGVEPVLGASVSPNLFGVLGVAPVLGRVFTDAETAQGERLVLVSYRFWQARLGGAASALGASVVINGMPWQVIGVLPAGFQAARTGADVWAAHSMERTARGGETWFAVGRLRPGVPMERAQAELGGIARRLNETLPAAERNRAVSVVPLEMYMVGEQSRRTLWVLGGAVFLVFLIAAANVTSLSLARNASRGREMAVRAALGASRGRILRQLLTEGILLGLLAGGVGTVLAYGGILLVRAYGPGNLARLQEIDLDVRVLGWAVGISMLAGVLAGLRPGGDGGGRSVAGGRGIRRTRRALVVADFALAIVLLTGAGLLLRSWWNVSSVDAGFRTERVVTMELGTPPGMDRPEQRAGMYARVLERVRAVPGVESVGIADDLFSENPREHVLTVDRGEGMVSERVRLTQDEVSVGFLSTLGTPLLLGRLFSGEDGPGGAPVAIINEAMARRGWPGLEVVGRRLGSDGKWLTVIGVVADMRRQGREREALPQIFVPMAQSAASRHVNLFVRAGAGDPMALTGSVRMAVREVDRNALVYGAVPLEQQLGNYQAQRRFLTSLLAGFSLVALLMAAVGIYGLIQYSISTRTREIGIRMAVGAAAGEIFRMILAEGLQLSLAGLGLGLSGALWMGEAGRSLLVGVAPADPVTLVAVSALLTGVAMAACCIPARRAMRIEPVAALRQE